MRCRMPAAIIVGPDILRQLYRATQKFIRQRRFSDTRRTDQADRFIALEILLEGRNTLAGKSADDMNWNAGCYCCKVAVCCDDFARKICLIEHDNRNGAA